MFYKTIGIISGSSLDGLDMAYIHLQETAGTWTFDILHTACYAYEPEWEERLRNAIRLPSRDYMVLHAQYGRYIGLQVNRFIEEFSLQHRVDLVSSHGHTSFHEPELGMTGQLGDGASIAALTGLPVVTDLRAMDVALGGQGAPIVPIGEKLLLGEYDYFLNLGGIANISRKTGSEFVAFDVCPANRILNMLAQKLGLAYDADGAIAATGRVNPELLQQLNSLGFYTQPWPKSLDNRFGTDTVFPLIEKAGLTVPDAMATMVEHTACQLSASVRQLKKEGEAEQSLLATGGGALNGFLVQRIGTMLEAQGVKVIVPDRKLVEYKEALVMALMGTLRWRQEYTTITTVTGASKGSIGGALWMGGEA